MNHHRLMWALALALMIHVAVIGYFSGLKLSKPVEREKVILPVELIQVHEEKVVQEAPEKPDLLAQVNKVVKDKPSQSETAALPKPQSNPVLGRSMEGGEEHNSAVPEQSSRPKAPVKSENRKDVVEHPEKNKKDTPKTSGKAKRHEQALSRPLNLSPTLSELNRWDDELREQENSQGGREQTLDLNTSKVRYAVYFSHLKEQIEQGWVYPQQAKHLSLSGNLRLKFTIGRDGRLLDLKILRSSGESILDESAMRAVQAAAPFAPFPESWQLEKIHVTTTFEYIRRKLLWGK
ncbi:MAG: energy transducer TonB [Magnetococcales bacterium]|nr:energy transducer TonB [Magnetococcales bacterium]